MKITLKETYPLLYAFLKSKAEIGEIHVWKDGKQHRKTADGWEEVPEEEEDPGDFYGDTEIQGNEEHFHKAVSILFPGKKPTLRELAQMAGAHKDEKVTLEQHKSAIKIRISHPDYTSHSRVSKSEGNLRLVIEFVSKKNKRMNGIGARMVKNQILSGSKYGISRIECLAERRALKNGYNTWARLGFDGLIPEKLKSDPVFRKFTNVSELMGDSGLKEYWKFYGSTFFAKFDLHKDSKNIKYFYGYIQEKQNA